jgi:hypothetical protein
MPPTLGKSRTGGVQLVTARNRKRGGVANGDGVRIPDATPTATVRAD